MVRVKDLEESLDFYCNTLGLQEVRRVENEKGRFTLVFLKAPEDTVTEEHKGPLLELTYNWPARAGGDAENYTGGRNFGHLAYEVDNIYGFCEKLQKQGITINRPPKEGRMAFIRSPDGISIELLQKGPALPIREPWQSMPNTGTW